MDQGLSVRPARARFSDDATDLALLERIDNVDRHALRPLYNTYSHPLLRFIYRITGRLDLAQEGVNDVMLVVWRNSRSFGGRSSVSTWIMGIGYRKALKLLAASRRWTDRFAAAGDARADVLLDGVALEARERAVDEPRQQLERAVVGDGRGIGHGAPLPSAGNTFFSLARA